MEKFLSNKGQIISYDFYVSVAIFLITLGFITYYFYLTITDIEEERERKIASDLLFSISNIFFDEGLPNDWNQTNFIRIGLSTNKKINSTKLEILKNVSYSKFLTSFSTGLYYVKIEIYDKNNNLIFYYPDISIEGSFILKIERNVMINESFGKGIVYLFKK